MPFVPKLTPEGIEPCVAAIVKFAKLSLGPLVPRQTLIAVSLDSLLTVSLDFLSPLMVMVVMSFASVKMISDAVSAVSEVMMIRSCES